MPSAGIVCTVTSGSIAYVEVYGGMSRIETATAGLASRRLSRRQFLSRALALGISAPAAGALLAACGDDGSDPLPTPSPSFTTATPQKLYLYNRQNEIAPANKTKFFEKTGITVVETFFDDNESLIANLEAGATGFDLVVPSTYIIPEMVRAGLLQTLHLDLLPNLTNLSPEFPVFGPADAVDGAKYGVPHVWGTTGIAVRADMVKDEVASWKVLWDPQHRGRITMLDDERETIGAALKMLGHSLNSTDPDELAEATARLIEQRPLVRAYDSFSARRNIVSGVPLVHTRCAAAELAATDLGADKVAYVLPQEGFTIWTDNLCVPVGARSAYAAHLFIDFMLEGQNAAELVNYTRHSSPNAAATPFLDKRVVESLPSEEVLALGERQADLGKTAAAYAAAWSSVRAT
jgi:spermidine/putrescine transport system substrate-binding protein